MVLLSTAYAVEVPVGAVTIICMFVLVLLALKVGHSKPSNIKEGGIVGGKRW